MIRTVERAVNCSTHCRRAPTSSQRAAPAVGYRSTICAGALVKRAAPRSLFGASNAWKATV
jgi:hypothetical protein